MFGDTLLESSSAPRKGKRWPMATAFTAEAIIGGLLVIIPLLSTGVIPVSARVPIYTPVKPVTLEPVERVHTEHTSAAGPANPGTPTRAVVLFTMATQMQFIEVQQQTLRLIRLMFEIQSREEQARSLATSCPMVPLRRM